MSISAVLRSTFEVSGTSFSHHAKDAIVFQLAFYTVAKCINLRYPPLLALAFAASNLAAGRTESFLNAKKTFAPLTSFTISRLGMFSAQYKITKIAGLTFNDFLLLGGLGNIFGAATHLFNHLTDRAVIHLLDKTNIH